MQDVSKRWYALDVTVDPQVSDAVEGLLNEFDCLGIEIDQLRKKPDEDVVVTGYFDAPIGDEIIEPRLVSAVEAFRYPSSSLRSFAWREVFEEDWLAEWKKHWKPTVVGRFIIAPPWEDVDEADGIIIRIEPNMAFGTGTHETTQLCLAAISELYRPPWSVLDVGTGTGILAIATAKLGATDIYACDTDADSVKIARENASLNAADVAFELGPLESHGPIYDFVLANLTLDVILPILDVLLARSGSILVLSGILGQQEAAIRNALSERDFDNPVVQSAGEWISVVIHK